MGGSGLLNILPQIHGKEYMAPLLYDFKGKSKKTTRFGEVPISWLSLGDILHVCLLWFSG